MCAPLPFLFFFFLILRVCDVTFSPEKPRSLPSFQERDIARPFLASVCLFSTTGRANKHESPPSGPRRRESVRGTRLRIFRGKGAGFLINYESQKTGTPLEREETSAHDKIRGVLPPNVTRVESWKQFTQPSNEKKKINK